MEVTRDILGYVTDTKDHLYLSLVHVVQELCQAYDHLGFLKSQELEAKRDVWTADPAASIQTRDRTASYAIIHITTEIVQLEAHIHALQLERALIERLIDAS